MVAALQLLRNLEGGLNEGAHRLRFWSIQNSIHFNQTRGTGRLLTLNRLNEERIQAVFCRRTPFCPAAARCGAARFHCMANCLYWSLSSGICTVYPVQERITTPRSELFGNLPQDIRDRLPDDVQVHPEAALFDVFQVEFDPFLEVGAGPAGALDLP
jgi:hypothetical protein